jgi:hypothetical protein
MDEGCIENQWKWRTTSMIYFEVDRASHYH